MRVAVVTTDDLHYGSYGYKRDEDAIPGQTKAKPD